MSEQLLDQLLHAQVQTAQTAPEQITAQKEPRRRKSRRMDEFDRNRLKISALVGWGIGGYLTYVAAASFGLSWLQAILVAIATQVAISTGQMLVLRAPSLLAFVAGLVLLLADAALNIAGIDAALPGIAIVWSAENPLLWVVGGIGILIAGLPELFADAARR